MKGVLQFLIIHSNPAFIEEALKVLDKALSVAKS